MKHQSMLPEELHRKADGELRRVGFEIEFGGLTFDSCLATLDGVIPGPVERVSPIEATIDHEAFGKFELELDWQFLKDQAREDNIQEDWMKLIGDIAGTVVPLEVVFPPIEVDRLEETNEIIRALREAGASGTHDSPLYAFGVHINPELPDLESGTLARYLKAFALLQRWLMRAHGIDSSRRISPYVDPYKRKYLNLVIDYDDPGIERILEDYLEHNPTRNRGLDLLPLLSVINAERVQKAVDDDRVKARPTFHYRMPNCDVGNSTWTLMTEWNRWCVVELLANSDDLEALAGRYRKWRDGEMFPSDGDWLAIVDEWVSSVTR